jgi:hypothetical protein
MKKFLAFSLAILIILTFTACKKTQFNNTNPYNGKGLNLAIIGEIPEIREKQIKFTKILFSDLEKEKFNSEYDAIFITKANLSEAAQVKYVSIYKKSKIPIFFIQTKKSYIPFTQEDLSYEQAPDVPDKSYATGILFKDNKLNYWEYGLYNNIENQVNIKAVYSKIFETISENALIK